MLMAKPRILRQIALGRIFSTVPSPNGKMRRYAAEGLLSCLSGRLHTVLKSPDPGHSAINERTNAKEVATMPTNDDAAGATVSQRKVSRGQADSAQLQASEQELVSWQLPVWEAVFGLRSPPLHQVSTRRLECHYQLMSSD